MSIITYFDAIGDAAKGLVHFHAKTLVFTGAETATGFQLVTTNGIAVDVGGSGLTYDGNSYVQGGVTGGMITSLDFHDVQGSVLLTVTGFSLAGPALTVGLFNSSGGVFLGGADTMIGSKNDDYLYTAKGNDVLRGGAGKDFIQGGTGSDRMTGDGGADSFVFAVKDRGHDRIIDFQDTGAVTDDKIGITAAMHDTMVALAVTGGVDLHFGAHETVFVAGWSLGQIGMDDFTLFA